MATLPKKKAGEMSRRPASFKTLSKFFLLISFVFYKY